MEQYKVYWQSPEEVAQQLTTDLRTGLKNQLVYERRAQYGPNALAEQKPDSYWRVFVRQFQNPLVYLLLIAAVIIFFVEPGPDVLFICCILLLNALVGTYQEGRAGFILASLRTLLQTTTMVVREGVRHIIPTHEVVVGDLIILQSGDQVPADARIVEAHDVLVNEAAITGEAIGVVKTAASCVRQSGEDDLPIHEQTNMLFAGSKLLRGSARAIVVGIGAQTVLGSMQKEIAVIDTEMPLKHDVEHVTVLIIWWVIGICCMLLLIGYMRGLEFRALLSMIAALFICVVPEGLPVIFTLVLALGVERMARKNMLIKRLQAVEGLGRVDTLAFDKTGTLTYNQLHVQRVMVRHELIVMDTDGAWTSNPAIGCLPVVAALMSEAFVERVAVNHHTDIMLKGDPTEAALTYFAQRAGVTKETYSARGDIVLELPFSSKEKMKLCVVRASCLQPWVQSGQEYGVLITGAPEIVCAQTQEYAQDLAVLIAQGYRVIAAAWTPVAPDVLQQIQELESGNKEEEIYQQIKDHTRQVLGLFALADLVRSDARSVVAAIQNLGVRMIMITGDHGGTAQIVAQQCGIAASNQNLFVASHNQHVTQLLPDEFMQKNVFARIMPAEKLTIVRMLQQQGHMVAMIGDGVNDVPGLAAADVGVAMGVMGTEIAKEAADMILLDDQLRTLIEGILEGRHIFSLLKRVILYFFSTNAAEILIIVFAILFHTSMPFTAMQILWLNFITDGVMTLALAFEPLAPAAYQKPLAQHEVQLLDSSMWFTMFFLSSMMAVGSFALFVWYQTEGLAKARTIALLSMAFFQLGNAWNARAIDSSLMNHQLKTNWYLVGASVVTFILQIALVHISVFANFFRVAPLTLFDWSVVLLMSSTIFVWNQLRKKCIRLIR